MADQQAESEGDQRAWSLELAAIPDKRGESCAKMLIVGASARFLFYPTLIYNLVRNKLQSEFRWWDEIDQFVLLGAVPFPGDIPRLKEAGVHAVVTLNESYETLVPSSLYKEQGIDHLVIPTTDYLFAPSFADIRRAVAFIHDHAQEGKKTYVHCKAGRGRSTTIVLCYLVQHRGMTPLEAFHYVKSRRPRILLAASQWQAVVAYSKNCQRRLSLEAQDTDGTQEAATASETGSQEPEEAEFTLGSWISLQEEFEHSSSVTDVDDSVVLVNTTDLIGYHSIEDAGLVGNELWWKDGVGVGVVCRLRLLAASAGKASTAWSKLSALWMNPKAEASSCKQMAVYSLEVLPSGMVN